LGEASPSSGGSARVLKSWWFRRNGGASAGNFGDELGPILVHRVSGWQVEYAPIPDCDLVSVGSILHTACKTVAKQGTRDGVLVWGSGLIGADGTRVPEGIRFCAVRGPGTIEELGLGTPLPTGDPGILASRYFKARPKKHKWGLVPHYSRRNQKPLKDAVRQNKSLFIDPTGPVDEVIGLISSCEGIVSSSLHGLIIADSFGIPCIWVNNRADDPAHSFKFLDYCAGVGRPPFRQIPEEEVGATLASDVEEAPVPLSPSLGDDLERALKQAL
jgi:pyruvyltransferase